MPDSAQGRSGAQRGPNRKWSLKITFPGNLIFKNRVTFNSLFPNVNSQKYRQTLALSTEEDTSMRREKLSRPAAAISQWEPRCAGHQFSGERYSGRASPPSRVAVETKRALWMLRRAEARPSAVCLQRGFTGPAPRWLVALNSEE